MAAVGALPPNLGVTAGSAPGSGSITQGTALPNITTTQAQATATPQFYTDYLNQLATQGQAAATNSQYVGATPLQQQAFGQVNQNVGNYQPALNQAQNQINTASGINPSAAAAGSINTAMGQNAVGAANPYLQSGANTNVLGAAQPYLNAASVPTSQTVQQYMSPYTNDVVNAIGNLGEANIAQNLAPQATAGIVGAGGFGSKRGQQALGEVLSNAGLGITGQQASALQSGYQNALTAAQNQANLYGQLGSTAGSLAQNQASNQLTAGQNLGALTNAQMANQLNAGQLQGNLAAQTQQGALNTATSAQNLGTTTQNLGLGDVNALSTLGAQQQTIGQNAQLFPMSQLTAESNLLKGATIPTATSSTYTGPIPGAYNTSPLAQIAGVGSVLAGTGLGQTLFGSPATGGQAATSGLVGSGLTAANSGLTSAANWIANGGSSTSNGGSGLPTGVTQSGTDPSTGLPTYTNSSGTPVDQFGNPATAAYTQQQADAQAAAQQQADAQAAAYAQQQADAQAALDAQNNGGGE